MIDLANPQAGYWGIGDELFDLTIVDDTARFTAAVAVDETAQAGTYQISGSRTSVNAIADGIEQRTGRPVPRRSYGSLEQPKQTLEAEGRGSPGRILGAVFPAHFISGSSLDDTTAHHPAPKVPQMGRFKVYPNASAAAAELGLLAVGWWLFRQSRRAS